jgi:hypothetical protein
MNNAQRYRMNAAERLPTAERCGPVCPTVSITHRTSMHHRIPFRTIAAAAAFGLTIGAAYAVDESKYPNFSSQWIRIGGVQWDPSKPQGLKQEAPLTPEYQAIYEKSLADQAGGGHGNDLRFTCRTSGMPRNMSAIFPFEIVIQPKVTFILSEYWMPRRIYTDGRARPEIIEPAFAGYSTGKWTDEDGDGHYDELEVERATSRAHATSTATAFPSTPTTRPS